MALSIPKYSYIGLAIALICSGAIGALIYASISAYRNRKPKIGCRAEAGLGKNQSPPNSLLMGTNNPEKCRGVSYHVRLITSNNGYRFLLMANG